MYKELPQRYTCFDDLPNNIKMKIKRIAGENEDYDAFVKGTIPAAGRSLLEIMNGTGGEEEAIKRLNRMICGH